MNYYRNSTDNVADGSTGDNGDNLVGAGTETEAREQHDLSTSEAEYVQIDRELGLR